MSSWFVERATVFNLGNWLTKPHSMIRLNIKDSSAIPVRILRQDVVYLKLGTSIFQEHDIRAWQDPLGHLEW